MGTPAVARWEITPTHDALWVAKRTLDPEKEGPQGNVVEHTHTNIGSVLANLNNLPNTVAQATTSPCLPIIAFALDFLADGLLL